MLDQVPGEEMSVEGEISKHIAKPEWGGWGIADVKVSSRKTIKVVGNSVGDFAPGMVVQVTGVWEETRYGPQLTARTILESIPDTPVGAVKWMSRHLKHIDEKRGPLLLQLFGEGVWGVLEHEPHRLTEISGITPARAEETHQSYMKAKQSRELLVQLYRFGLTAKEAKVLQRRTPKGLDPVSMLQTRPYTLLYGYANMGWARVQTLVTKSGVYAHETVQEDRLRAALLEGWHRESRGGGHTVVPRGRWIQAASELVGAGVEEARRKAEEAIRNELFVACGDGVMTPEFDVDEADIADRVLALLNAPLAPNTDTNTQEETGSGRDRTDAGAEGSGRDGPPEQGRDHHGACGLREVLHSESSAGSPG